MSTYEIIKAVKQKLFYQSYELCLVDVGQEIDSAELIQPAPFEGVFDVHIFVPFFLPTTQPGAGRTTTTTKQHFYSHPFQKVNLCYFRN